MPWETVGRGLGTVLGQRVPQKTDRPVRRVRVKWWGKSLPHFRVTGVAKENLTQCKTEQRKGGPPV